MVTDESFKITSGSAMRMWEWNQFIQFRGKSAKVMLIEETEAGCTMKYF